MDNLEKSVFFGKNRRIRPLWYSTVPFSQLAYGWQKYDFVPSSSLIFSCSEFSEPLSYVNERLKCSGKDLRLTMRVNHTASAVFCSSLSKIVYRLLRSIFTSRQCLLARLIIESLSQCPSCLRLSINLGRSSMDTLLGI